jgi:serine/threonine protein kinase
MDALPRVPGYELLQPLGGGPLTAVYSARDRSQGSPCAVKVIREDWEDLPTAIKLLQREARAGLAVRHPHLVSLLYAHVTRPPYFLVMELLPGESLRRCLRRDGVLQVVDAAWIARQTAEALAALHQAGFAHGDIKPDNVRLVGERHATLIDLGFAHRPGENAHLVKKGYIVGTANYLAPELCRFDEMAGTKSDVYSLGVMLFEMLTGRLPFPSGTVHDTFCRHLHDEPESLVRHAGRLPAALVRLVGRMLAREPAERPTTRAVVEQLLAVEAAFGRRRRAA